MSYDSDKFVRATISSYTSKISGQDHRCSNNYNLSKMKDLRYLKFTFEGGGTISLMQDKDMGRKDPYVANKITSGKTVDYGDCGKDNIYVADVTGTSVKTDMFCINIESVTAKEE